MSRILFLAFESPTPNPQLHVPTTPAAIRDRIYSIVEGLTPTSSSGDAFLRHRNELGADFHAWAEANPAACRRRFQVRQDGDIPSADVSNSDHEQQIVTYHILVAYPQTHRDGPDNAMDRDDAMEADRKQIETAIGMRGRSNLAPPYPDACWRSQTVKIDDERGAGVDFIDLTISYMFIYSMT